jgi:uncharacterized membrane protein
MKTENVLLMQQAREALKGKWDIAVGGCFLYMFITLVAGAPRKIGALIGFLIHGPMFVGLSTFSLSLARKEKASISQLFIGFDEFIKMLTAYFFMMLFIFLWALLLIVPGIIAALSYSQTFFILAEDKSIDARAAIEKSKMMMLGNKKKLFYLCLRFFGWFLLGILSMGIGFLWIMPYFQVTMAKFYDDISGKTVAENTAS